MNKRLVIALVSLYITSMVAQAAELSNTVTAYTAVVPITTTNTTTVNLDNSPLPDIKSDDSKLEKSQKVTDDSLNDKNILVKTDNYYRVEQNQRGLLVVIQDFYTSGEKRTDSFTVASKDKAKQAAFDNISYEDMGVAGLFISWFKTGQIEQKGVFDQGLRKGLWVVWYENGQKKSSGRYKNGLREGQWTTWYQNGKRMQKGTYRAGKREGVWIFWYGNGKKKEAGRYSDDEKVERWSYWDQSGKMIINNMITDGPNE